MRSVTGKEFAKILERHGWTLLRIQGSHFIYGKPNIPTRITLPVHKNQTLKVGLLKSLMRIAELSENDLT
jgi:predicted RNA binding protein YcfA (HicA-like mRNA interferase family)